MIVREVNIHDEPKVHDLWLRNGLKPHARANDWGWLWRDNPFCPSGWTWGWVIEDCGRICGYIGNLPLRYHYEGRELTAACARGFVVDAEARSYSLKLASAFFLQKNVDLLLLSTANEVSSPVYRLFKAMPLPVERYGEQLVWFIGGYRSVRFLLRKSLDKTGKSLPGVASSLIALFLALPASLVLWLRRLGSGADLSRWGGDVVVMSPEVIDVRWDQLFDAVRHQYSSKLLGDRGAAVLKWHYALAENGKPRSFIVAAMRNGAVAGYLVMTRNGATPEDEGRYLLSDIVVMEDDPSVLEALLDRAFAEVRRRGGMMVESIGFPGPIRKRLLSRRPFIRGVKADLFWYRTSDAELAERLERESAWYVTPFDGDSSL